MTSETLYGLAPPLIALQFLAFGWRVNREINVADAGRQTVIPLPDVINIMSLFATVGCLIVLSGRNASERKVASLMRNSGG
jgi:hypothetical protein